MYSTIISGRVYLFFLHFYYFIPISRTIIKLDECSIILIHVYIYLSFNRKSVFWFFTSFQYFMTTLGAKLLSLRLQRRIRRARKPDGVFRDSLSFANAHSCVSHFTLPTCECSRSPARLIGTRSRNTFTVVWPFAMPLVGSPWLENQSGIGLSGRATWFLTLTNAGVFSIYCPELNIVRFAYPIFRWSARHKSVETIAILISRMWNI